MREVELLLQGFPIESVFELLGRKENDITYSLGWVLSRCPTFRESLLSDVLPEAVAAEVGSIHLQEGSDHGGYTDIELQGPNVHLIVEAKRGWNLPSEEQLSLYAKRLMSPQSRTRRLLVLSECSEEYATLHLPKYVDDVAVTHRGWHEIGKMSLITTRSTVERRLLKDFRTYLGRIVEMQNQRSNMVFVVSLSRGMPEWADISSIDIVRKRGYYFHILGSGWPKEPPNYIGFRHDGRLQSIHHIEDYEVVEDMRTRIPEIHDGPWEPHMLYELGPAIHPPHEVKTGKVYASGRVWAMLDLLLTVDTVSDARDRTQARLELES